MNAREMVSYARSLCEDVEFSAEDALRSDPAFLYEVYSVAVEVRGCGWLGGWVGVGKKNWRGGVAGLFDVYFSVGGKTTGLCSPPTFVHTQAGATTLNVPDTVGYTTPSEFKTLIQGLRANVKGQWWRHCPLVGVGSEGCLYRCPVPPYRQAITEPINQSITTQIRHRERRRHNLGARARRLGHGRGQLHGGDRGGRAAGDCRLT